MKTKNILLIIFLAAATAALIVLLWLNGTFLPGWITWNSTEEELDLDGDGTAEKLILNNRKVYITQDGKNLYKSPFTWRVSDVFAQDLDADGVREIVMLVWKHGSYGPNRPFWDSRDTIAFSQHVFVFRCQDQKMSSVWMSSDIGRKITRADFDEDGMLRLLDINGEETAWAWDDWGFELAEERPENPKTAEAEAAAADKDQNPTEEQSSPEAETADNSQKSPEIKGESSENSKKTESESDSQKKKEKKEAEKKKKEKPKKVSLIAVGDNLAHIAIVEQSYDPETGLFDFTYLYSKVKKKISSYDIAIVNQETILVYDPEQRSGFPMFATPNTMGDALVDAGFDVILCANNHSYDCGAWGIEETLQFWRENYPDIEVIGLYSEDEGAQGEPDYVNYVEKNGIRFAMFNLTEETNGLELPWGYTGGVDLLNDREKLIRELLEAENEADLSICFLHFGEEYSTEPNEAQRQLVQELTDAGADLFICSHPHVLQKMETLETPNGAKSIVYWSLGNFVSHQVDLITVLEGAASVKIEKKGDEKAKVVSHELLPMLCHFDGYSITQPYFLEDYPEDLAWEHLINSYGPAFTKESLMQQYEQLKSLQS